jgi:hypothetical protein
MLTSITPNLILVIFILVLFSLGGVAFVTGILILAISAASQGVRTLASQVTNLAQKGITDDIAGLVGNAATLINGLNQLTKTKAGIGVFLTILGLLMMTIACYLAIKTQPLI